MLALDWVVAAGAGAVQPTSSPVDRIDAIISRKILALISILRNVQLASINITTNVSMCRWKSVEMLRQAGANAYRMLCMNEPALALLRMRLRVWNYPPK